MARSIHTTLRDFRDRSQDRFRDRDHQRGELRRIRDDLRRKRLIKAQVAGERRGEPAPGPVRDPAAIPIVVEDDAEHLHHGATAVEIVGVLRRLPPGVADGIRAIRLGLGMEWHDEEDDEGEADPLTGRRPSWPILPGVHCGRVLGVYTHDRAEIYLCAYAAARPLAEARIKALYLTVQTLGTLVHEVAHHHDYTQRIARGRWRADDTRKKERYAERMEHAWVAEVVLPYLEEHRADDVAHLRAWTLRHAGVDVPLAALVDDPRRTRKDGLVGMAFRFRDAFDALLTAVEAGDDPIDTRIELARDLHYTDGYALPRAILAAVLAERPGHPEALTLLADIDVHEGHHGDAEARCRQVLAAAPDHAGAWIVLVDALRPQARWAEIVDAASRGLACVDAATDAGDLLRHRAHAHLERGDHVAVTADLIGLSLGSPRFRCWAQTLRAMQLLRLGQLEAALALAVRLLGARGYAGRVEVVAVRFEAAHRLGRPAEAVPLTALDLRRLRGLGHRAWAERLGALR